MADSNKRRELKRLLEKEWNDADVKAAYQLFREAEPDLAGVLTTPVPKARIAADPRLGRLDGDLTRANRAELIRRARRLGAARPDLVDDRDLRDLILREAKAGRQCAFAPAPARARVSEDWAHERAKSGAWYRSKPENSRSASPNA